MLPIRTSTAVNINNICTLSFASAANCELSALWKTGLRQLSRLLYAPSPRDNAPLHTPPPHLSQRVSTSSCFFPPKLRRSALYCCSCLQYRSKGPITSCGDQTMAKAPPQAPVAAACPPATRMQDGAGPANLDQGHVAKISGQPTPTTAAQEITRRDVHTASSVSAQRRVPKSNKAQVSGQQAATPRASSREATNNTPSKFPTTTGSKPVLVRGPSTKPDMKKKHSAMKRSASPKLPPVESFSFQDILNSIGSEADASIDAIAEICGRSKMSLAAEHSSHRPPQGQLATTRSSPDPFFLPARLEPVAETSSNRPHTRSMSRSLALATGSAHNGDGLPSDPTAATSNVTSHTHTSTSRHGNGDGASTTASASLLPQVLAWLRGSSSTTANEHPSGSVQDIDAVSAMHRLLNDTSEAQM